MPAPNRAYSGELAPLNVTSVLKAAVYKLNFQFVDLPLVDERGYANHSLGVAEIPGLFVVGLPG